MPESRFELQHSGSPSKETALEGKAQTNFFGPSFGAGRVGGPVGRLSRSYRLHNPVLVQGDGLRTLGPEAPFVDGSREVRVSGRSLEKKSEGLTEVVHVLL